MPVYEYKCKECGEKFEKLVKMDAEVRCPKCGGEVEKLISAFNFSCPVGCKSCKENNA